MLLLKALLVLGSATAVFASAKVDAIVSGAMLIGQDTSKHDSHGEDMFKDPRNHPGAVASLLRFSAERADFHPRQKGVITDPKVYEHFLKDVYDFPGFRAHRQQHQQLDLQGDREQFKREIAKKYMSDRIDGHMMARAFENLLPREVNQNDQEWLLNYVVLDANCERSSSCELEVEITSIMLKLYRDSNSDHTKIRRQTAQMAMNKFNVKKEYLIEHASSLAQRVRTMRARKALKELSSTGRLGDDDEDNDVVDLDLENWLQGSDMPNFYPISRWNVQF
jgi:hypothetical protein